MRNVGLSSSEDLDIKMILYKTSIESMGIQQAECERFSI